MKKWINNIISIKESQKNNKQILIADIISGIVLLLFLYTSLSKLEDYSLFRNVLTVSPLLKSVSGIIAWVLTVTEIIIVILLFIPRMRLKGLYTSLWLMILFTLYIGYMILFAEHLPCNCGGVLQQMNWREHLIFNLFFIGLSIIGIKLYHSNKSIVAINRQPDQPPQGKS